MIGTSAAFVTTNIVAKQMLGGTGPTEVAMAAAIVGTSMFAIGLVLSFLLPQPKQENPLE
jgi:Na+-driven multidrug efflux pump